jgi:hypothetical protein
MMPSWANGSASNAPMGSVRPMQQQQPVAGSTGGAGAPSEILPSPDELPPPNVVTEGDGDGEGEPRQDLGVSRWERRRRQCRQSNSNSSSRRMRSQICSPDPDGEEYRTAGLEKNVPATGCCCCIGRTEPMGARDQAHLRRPRRLRSRHSEAAVRQDSGVSRWERRMWGMYVTATLSGGYDADSEWQPKNHRADLRTHPSA